MLYNAFLSYNQEADIKLAAVLQSALHNFAKPWYRLRSIRIFRDKTNMAATAALWPSTQTALNESEYFLLLASPKAAQSPWVAREIDWWLQNRSPEKMLIILTDGELVWDKAANDYDWRQTTALPGSLQNRLKDEPLYVDLRWTRSENNFSLRNPRFRGAILDIATPLYGKPKDNLDGEAVRQLRRNKQWAWSAGVILLIAIISVVKAIYSANEQSNVAFSRQLATQSELIVNRQPGMLPQSVLIAAEALKHSLTFEADQAIYHGLSLLGPKPVVQRSYQGLKSLVLSPHGKYLAQVPWDGSVIIQETISGKKIAELLNVFPGKPLLSENRVDQVSFSTNENCIATVSALGLSTFVWEIPSGREIFRTPMNRHEITTAILSDNGKYLATGNTHGMVYVYNVTNGNEALNFTIPDPPQIMKFSPDSRCLAVTSSMVNVYGPASSSIVQLTDIITGKPIARLLHSGPVSKIVFSPNGKYLATTSMIKNDDTIKMVTIWDTANGHQVTQIQHEGSDKAINSITFTPNSKYLLTGSSDDTSRVWDIANGRELLRMNHGNTVDLAAILIIDDLSCSITAGGDGIIRLWSSDSPKEDWLRLPESPNISTFAQNIDGQYLATISYDLRKDVTVSPNKKQKDLRVWTIASIRKLLRLKHEHTVGAVRFSPNGRYLATLDFQEPEEKLIPPTETADEHFEYSDLGSGGISIWDMPTRKRLAYLKHPGKVMSFANDPTGKYIATACVDGFVRVWEAAGGKEIARLKRDGWVYDVAFSPDGRYMAASSGNSEHMGIKNENGLVTIWEWRTGREIGHLQSSSLIPTLAFSPDGKLLSAGGLDGTVYLIKTTDVKEVQRFQGGDSVWVLAFSPDGCYLAAVSGGTDPDNYAVKKGATTLWRVKDAQPTVLQRHRNWAITIAFSPDGKYLASMDLDGLIGIWSVADGKKIANIMSPKDRGLVIQAKVTFSPDSKYLATMFGNKVEIRDAATGMEIIRRDHGGGFLWDVAFSPDGRYLATASNDTTVRLWLWRPKDLINEAASRLTRNLTHVEWRQYVGNDKPYHATFPNLKIPKD